MTAVPHLLPLLARLETPECDCPFEYDGDGRMLPCPHVLATPMHDLPVDVWAEALVLADPAAYAEPPAPLQPRRCRRRRARVEVMRQRHARHLGLYDPGDCWQRTAEDDRMAIIAERERNGAVTEGELRAEGGAV